MKTYATLFLAFVLLSLGCEKVTISTDQRSLEEYVADENLAVQEGPEGLLYIIEEPGSAERPTINSMVTVNYVGRLTDDRIFDQTNGSPVSFPLGNLVRGWQLGIPLVGAGGKIKLLLPPSLGYGNRPVGSIPANSNLVFDIELVSFTN
ncbi:FKBP-type peptidyl-prolyl cis-trans isomerase [Neolewinella lacunae]|uniref:Peptidyl-prolyl cis-trans isomerase n=1 Tax=Neolewinella lacunae TaxID=1517758 RepID=A0A923T785_9BACT|nr:FKBP-type peptidyl-prolyl cis-trans isomerase [Neolewinella lacunae]MBC6994225.1 FKBP-type peptidyl-prolyl cis-trans isomerase [Neolewinella lacunae]MDN3634616.1 FKBP-type peptidyl-prolyl cis-trans isomerase [Neolewinella lacunae]